MLFKHYFLCSNDIIDVFTTKKVILHIYDKEQFTHDIM